MRPYPRNSATCLLPIGIALTFLLPRVAHAHLTKFDVTSRGPAFGGFSWPGVESYEKIVGIGSGEVNPLDPKNSVMVDIQLAPRNPNGNVEYSFDFYILKPLDLTKGAHKVMYEPPNRGNKLPAPRPRRARRPSSPRSISARLSRTTQMVRRSPVRATSTSSPATLRS